MHEKNMMATLYYEHKVAVELQQWRLSALTSQHRVLVLGCADQPADTINHLALRVQLFFLRLLAEKNHWEGRKKQSHIQKSEKNTLIMRNPQSLVSQVMEDAAALLAQSLLGEAS